jgi:hemerythrin
MTSLPWAKSHLSGVREIDSTNECLEFLLERHFLQGFPCESTGRHCPKIEDLMRFLVRKFEREEILMERVGFPGLVHHRGEHAKLLARLDIMKANLACGAYDSQRVFSVVATWAVRHLREFDDPFGHYLAREASPRPEAGKPAWRLEI